mgnify:CR=1 FL=1
MKNIISLYHCNFENHINMLTKNGKLKISTHSKDKEWGGSGMYFWDNVGNAKYWKREKQKSQVNQKLNIVRCNIEIDLDEDLLDLTDFFVEKDMEKLLYNLDSTKEICKAPVGDKIDFICKKLEAKVVKFFGDYSRTPKTIFTDADSYNTRITNKVKVIYCIKESNESLIIDSKIIV